MSQKRSDPVRLVHGHQEVNDANPLPVEIIAGTAGDWRVALFSDENANDSDKAFQVPLSTEWQILWVWVEFASTGTVGNRQLEVQVLDAAGDVIAVLARASVVQTASLTRLYLFAPGENDMPGFRDTDYLTTPIPVTTFLSAQQTIRIFDNNAVDAAADDMEVQMQIALRTI